MYKCEEEIVDESLEWDQSKQVKVGMPYGIKQKKSLKHKQAVFNQKFSVKNNATDLSTKDITFFSIAATLLFPYMLGLMFIFFLWRHEPSSLLGYRKRLPFYSAVGTGSIFLYHSLGDLGCFKNSYS